MSTRCVRNNINSHKLITASHGKRQKRRGGSINFSLACSGEIPIRYTITSYLVGTFEKMPNMNSAARIIKSILHMNINGGRQITVVRKLEKNCGLIARCHIDVRGR